MKTNDPKTFKMELNRTVALNVAFGSREGVNGRGWSGGSARLPRSLRLKVPQEPDQPVEAPARRRSKRTVTGERPSAFTLYMRDIGPVKLLSREEEVELARRLKAGDETAREEMIKANLRLVVKIAHDFDRMGVSLLDLINEGNIGLMKAVERYDPAKGAKLSSYAAFWIKQRIRRALGDQASIVRLPAYVQDKLPTIRTAILQLQEQLGRDPSNEEIARYTKLPAAGVQRMREVMQPSVSLDESLDDQKKKSVAEIVADGHSSNPYETLAHTTTMENLGKVLGELSPREQRILRSRFGLEGEGEATLDEIGQQLGLTRERVRQIQNSALAKLRNKLTELEEQHVPA